MNKELNDIIDKEAAKHGIKFGRNTTGYYNTEQDRENSFIEGATFATTDPSVLASLLKPALEWIEKNAMQNPDDERFWFVDGDYFDHEELIQKYLLTINSKL